MAISNQRYVRKKNSSPRVQVTTVDRLMPGEQVVIRNRDGRPIMVVESDLSGGVNVELGAGMVHFKTASYKD